MFLLDLMAMDQSRVTHHIGRRHKIFTTPTSIGPPGSPAREVELLPSTRRRGVLAERGTAKACTQLWGGGCSKFQIPKTKIKEF